MLRERVLLSGRSEPYTALGADEDPSRCQVRTWRKQSKPSGETRTECRLETKLQNSRGSSVHATPEPPLPRPCARSPIGRRSCAACTCASAPPAPPPLPPLPPHVQPFPWSLTRPPVLATGHILVPDIPDPNPLQSCPFGIALSHRLTVIWLLETRRSGAVLMPADLVTFNPLPSHDLKRSWTPISLFSRECTPLSNGLDAAMIEKGQSDDGSGSRSSLCR